jgi:glycolate oxidase FAD binding subunit
VEAWPDGRDAATESTVLMVGTAIDDLCDVVASAVAVAPVGSRTHWEVGGPPPAGTEVVEVQAPDGVVTYDPADLTVTVGAGTTCAELTEILAAAGQECALDPRDPTATVGGLLATGLSGHRRLRLGPLRDRVLEVRFVTADGRLVKGGGPTVKNVSGYDLPRLLVGSLGTLGVLVQVTLRCQPRPATSEWFTTTADPFALRRALYQPSCIAWDGATTHVLVEGAAADVDAQRGALDASAARSATPAWPDGPHRGRISVRPSRVRELAPALDAAAVRWLAEVGVGTVHVAADDEAALARARAAAESAAGWMLREAGAPGLDGFGIALPNARLGERIRAAFDPSDKCTPGRLPRGPEHD